MTTPEGADVARSPLDLLALELERLQALGAPIEPERLAAAYGLDVADVEACWAAVQALASASDAATSASAFELFATTPAAGGSASGTGEFLSRSTTINRTTSATPSASVSTTPLTKIIN